MVVVVYVCVCVGGGGKICFTDQVLVYIMLSKHKKCIAHVEVIVAKEKQSNQ